MIPDKLKNDFNSLRNMFDELKREIDKNVVKEENYKGEFYEIAPYSYQRNRFKQGKIVGNVTSLKTTNNLFTYYFDAKNQIIEIREGLELKNQFYYTFFIYEKELMKTIAYDNSKRIVNVRYYLYGSNGKIEKMYSKGTRADRHGQLVPRAVRADPPQDQGRGRDLLHVHGGEAHQLQPLLHGRLQVQRGEEGQHQDAAAGAVEGRGRENHEDGERRAGQCGVGVHPPDTTEPGHRPLVRHLLRVHAERLPEGAGCKGHQGEPGGFQHRQLPDHAAAVLQGRALRLPAELEREHRPAAQAVHRLRDRRREGQRRAVPRGYDHHHGSLHQQAAPPERGAEDADLRGGLESPFLAEYE